MDAPAGVQVGRPDSGGLSANLAACSCLLQAGAVQASVRPIPVCVPAGIGCLAALALIILPAAHRGMVGAGRRPLGRGTS